MREEQSFCEFCGPTSIGHFYSRGSSYRVLKCGKCDLLWSDPLTDENYEKLISSDYWGEHIYLRKEKQQKERFRKQINKVLDIYRSGTERSDIKVLDIGSGLGFLLDVCEEKGINAQGCDINEKAVEYSNRQKNRTRLGTVDSFYQDSSFDIIFALNLIEHIPHPNRFITECRRILKPGGLLVLETPIQESLFHIFARIGDILTRYKMNNYGINTNGHIYKFCNRTFDKIRDIGFDIIMRERIGSPLKEITGKISYMSPVNKVIMRLVLPVTWSLAQLFGLQNRLFIIFKKK